MDEERLEIEQRALWEPSLWGAWSGRVRENVNPGAGRTWNIKAKKFDVLEREGNNVTDYNCFWKDDPSGRTEDCLRAVWTVIIVSVGGCDWNLGENDKDLK